jgi:hypothetical protein
LKIAVCRLPTAIPAFSDLCLPVDQIENRVEKRIFARVSIGSALRRVGAVVACRRPILPREVVKMTLELSQAEVQAILRLLDAYLPEMDWEVARTEQREYGQSLKRDEDVLLRVRDRLRANTSAGRARP